MYLILCNPIDCSLPGSSVHGILQARILERVSLSSSSESSQPRDRTSVFCVLHWQVGYLPLHHLGSQDMRWGLEMWNHDTVSMDSSCERGRATEVRDVVSRGANKPELQKVQNTNMHRKACEKGKTWADVQPPHRMLCGDWPTANWYSEKYYKRPTETVRLCLGQAGE